MNMAAGGNRILADGLGPAALGRIERDVLAHPSVRYALIYEGVNDLGHRPGGHRVPDGRRRPRHLGPRPDGHAPARRGDRRVWRHDYAHERAGAGVRRAGEGGGAAEGE